MHLNRDPPQRSIFAEYCSMKLLLYSHFFAPSVGGVESIVLSLARGLTELRTPEGLIEFDLTLVTETPAGNFDDRSLPFRVLRQPSLSQLLRIIRFSDIVHIAGPSLSPAARVADPQTCCY